MSESRELEKIKKIYGEDFMKLCRDLFPTILEQEGRLYEILTTSFAGNSRSLYEDIVINELEAEFKNFIYSKINVEDDKKQLKDERTPYEILDEAGYDLTECTTEAEIQNFMRYYAPREELCTFNGGRLNKCFVFWAVKKDADSIKRENFKVPRREDEYGTSVMGIQFSKNGRCTVSIKNRYNHSVNNPDATYGNDLDRIAPGLTQSFSKLLSERGLELDCSNQEKFEIPGYVMASDGKYYKFNYEIDGIYYCPGNVIIEDREVRRLNPDKKILIDYFILDLENKEMTSLVSKDSFIYDLQQIEKIDVKKDKETGHGTREISIKKHGEDEPIIIKIDGDNRIIEYSNPSLTKVDDFFLCNNKVLTHIDAPRLTEVGNSFLSLNTSMKQLSLPNLRYAGNNFLHWNEKLNNLVLPNLREVGNSFLYSNRGLTQLELPNLRSVGNCFLLFNETLEKIELPKLEEVGDLSFKFIKNLSNLNAPFLPRNLFEKLSRIIENNSVQQRER